MNSVYTTIMLSGPHLLLANDISIVGPINETHVCVIMLSGPHLLLVDDISILGLINEIHVCTLSP